MTKSKLRKALDLGPRLLAERLFDRILSSCKLRWLRFTDLQFRSDGPDQAKLAPAVVVQLRDWLKGEHCFSNPAIPENDWSGWQQLEVFCGVVMDHRFELLGSSLTKVEPGASYPGFENQQYPPRISAGAANGYRPIDWHVDFRSGYRFAPGDWFLDVPIGKHASVDIKLPWELSRFYHLPALGTYYLKTGEESLTIEFVAEVQDWILNNPPRFGVNWRISMEVGIRACNWLLALSRFRDSPHITEAFLVQIASSLQDHYNYIRAFPERWPGAQPNNHYMANILGEVFLTFLCPWLGVSRQRQLLVIDDFFDQIEGQFHEDGSNFEGSTQYHRLVLEMALLGYGVLVRATDLSDAQATRIRERATAGKRRLIAALRYTSHLLKADGTVPQFGDNDSGRIFRLVPEASDVDHRHILALGEVIIGVRFGEQVDLSAARSFATLICHPTGDFEDAESVEEDQWFPGAGVYTKRMEEAFFGLTARLATEGHMHSDIGSFELNVRGTDFVVDGGSYCYTGNPDLRRAFRSVSSHSTIYPEDGEQNDYPGLFESVPRARNLKFSSSENAICVTHDAYGQLASRRISFTSDSLLIEDEFAGKSCLSLNLAPGISFQLSDQRLVSSHSISENGLGLEFEGLEEPQTLPGYYSPAYGKRTACTLLKFNRTGNSSKLLIRWR